MSPIETASLILALVLFHALIGKLGALRALFGPKLHAIALRDLTGIPLRADLVARFGPHDDEHRFAATPAAVFAARPWWRWVFGNIALEAALILSLISVALGALPATPWIPVAAGLYTLVSHVLVFRQHRASLAEVAAEIAHKEAGKRARRLAARR
jgi:hypothetical protein